MWIIEVNIALIVHKLSLADKIDLLTDFKLYFEEITYTEKLIKFKYEKKYKFGFQIPMYRLILNERDKLNISISVLNCIINSLLLVKCTQNI